MTIETKRLIMREMNQDDLPSLCKILQDPQVMYAYEHAFSDEEVNSWLNRQITRYAEHGFGLWAVISKETGEMIGQCGLTMQDWDGTEVMEIGYLFQKDFWHKGFATESAQACKEYAFDVLNATEVFSIIRDSNTASQNVAKRNGMKVCGQFTKHYYEIDMPHLVYSLKNAKMHDSSCMIDDIIKAKLFELQDLKYRDFHSKLVPTLDKNTVIGVRVPLLRKFSKEVSKTSNIADFLKILPHKYYEENNLHGFLIENIKDYDHAILAINDFLPFIDNWATCDLISPKVFKKHLPELLEEIKKWLESSHTYTIRFGIGMLLKFYLDNEFGPQYPALVASVKSEEYYVNMMIAWYFATALAKQYPIVLPYIEQRKLNDWTHNKAIQKAVESYRISDEQKAYLRTLKVSTKK